MAGVLDQFKSIFGAGTDTPTYESLKRKREIADALMQQTMDTPYRNWGDGVGGLMQALGARMMDSKVSGQEAAEGDRASSAVSQIVGALGPEGISMDDLSGLASATANPYLPPEQKAIARAMMRRKVTPDVGGAPSGFTGAGGIGELTSVSSKGPMQMADAGLPEDPAALYQKALEARRLHTAQPSAESAGALDAAGQKFIDGAEGQPDPYWKVKARELDGWVDGPDYDGPALMSGAGSPVQRGPTAGPMVAQADTGTMTDASVRGETKLTEQQSKDLGYWNRMDAVTPDIDTHTSDLTSLGEKMKDGVPLVGNMMVSEGYQVGRRAANEWITSLLRKDTGATVTTQEWALYGPIYIPQPGDDPPVIEAKKQARARAAEGMKAGLGIAEVLANELQAARKPAAAPASGGSDDWRTKDPSTWTDEQLQEYLK